MKNRAKTLKEISEQLNISLYMVYKIRNIIADNIRRQYNDWLIPNYMIFGGNGYSIKQFGEMNQQLEKNKEENQ